jgi:TRAP-type C4-dicarboxylate transport system permease small subunit|tara:strand:- start:299 stop:508 length:210 start_codon:yes stop_codon:yes gene_type:complete
LGVKIIDRGKMETALAILMIGLGAYLLLTSSSTLFNFNWNQKTNIEKIKMVIFYAVLIYLMNVVFWIFD